MSRTVQNVLPEWLDTDCLAEAVSEATDTRVHAALFSDRPAGRGFAALISSAAARHLEPMASRAAALTRRRFGRTVSLYAPLYLSNYCSSGCAYCGFASDRDQPRHKLDEGELTLEIDALKARGMEDVLLLTGERSAEADFEYLLACVSTAAARFHNVTVESFAMTTEEYARLAKAGCTGITLYQETYDPVLYDELHRWGRKRDYRFRLEAPARAFEAGMRTVGMGALLGLGNPIRDALSLYRHLRHLRKRFWQSGVLVSFPRLCHEVGDYSPAYEVDDRLLARLIFAFRICLPDVPLVLSTREPVKFRDGIAGAGISRMSVASRTTVGGYGAVTPEDSGQFDVSDKRDVEEFCRMLHAKGLEAVFKNWDSVFSQSKAAP